MTCRPFEIKDAEGNVVGGGFVCSRGERRKQCKFCAHRPATKLCDRELEGKRAGKTCDAPMCDACAVSIGPELDLCPPHARERHKKRQDARAWLEAQKLEDDDPPADTTHECDGCEKCLDTVDRGALERMFPAWDQVELFEGDERRASAPMVVVEEELCGSWHQQLNGGAKKTATASGELPRPLANALAARELANAQKPWIVQARENKERAGEVPWSNDGVAVNTAEMVAADRRELDRQRAAHSTPIGEKVAHVMRQGQTRSHTCHWPGCEKQVPPARWGCREHWYALPKNLRDKIWRAYNPGQEASMTPSREYLKVAQEVDAWIRTKLAPERVHEPEGASAYERAARRARERDAARKR